MAKRKPPAKPRVARKPRQQATQCEQYPEWTESRFWSFIRSALRSAANKWPPKWRVLADAKRESKSTTNRRLKYEYRCANCKGWFPQREISVDHIIPAGSLSSYSDLVGFTSKLFIGQEGLQCLCRECHGAKTARERSANKELKEQDE